MQASILELFQQFFLYLQISFNITNMATSKFSLIDLTEEDPVPQRQQSTTLSHVAGTFIFFFVQLRFCFLYTYM